MKEQSITTSAPRPIRAGIVGTGYIAEFHARGLRAADGAELAAVCDANLRAAEAFGAAWGVPAYPSLEAMIAEQRLDTVHVLVPPDLHHPLTKMALQAGLHVFLEKPMCVSADQAADLVATAELVGKLLRVNHSAAYIGAFSRLREHVRAGDLGPIDYASFNHFGELGPIRFGPFNSWMLRQPANGFFEIGSHLVAELVDLVGKPDRISATADRDLIVPGGARVYRRWRVNTTVGRTAADINIDLSPGFGQRIVLVRGLLGTGIADLDANICTIDRRTALDIDFDIYRRSMNQAAQIRRQARHVLADYILSKAKLRKRGNAYESSFLDSIGDFYRELQGRIAPDNRLTATLGRDVMEVCEQVVAAADLKPNEAPKPSAPAAAVKPTVLVLGGTGFIGKRLIQHLLDEGYAVRAAGRSGSPALEALGSDRLEIVRADIRSPEDLAGILDGIDYVFHLATTDAKGWDQYWEREVEPARALAEACLDRGVRRLVYTGTIDSYYAGARAGTITERTPLDPKIERRNYYARAKAAAEGVLMELHRTRGLPVVIVRPGIVIGRGGNPFHWGVGKWSTEGVCEVWGEGRNQLPLVLVDDVAAGLVLAMKTPGIEGKSYNLIDAPLLSARDYLDELQRRAGMKIDIHYRPIRHFYLNDLVKWVVKKAVGHPDAKRVPSYHDWESRTQKAHFDCTRTRDELGWKPVSDRGRLIDEGIGGSLAAWLAVRN